MNGGWTGRQGKEGEDKTRQGRQRQGRLIVAGQGVWKSRWSWNTPTEVHMGHVLADRGSAEVGRTWTGGKNGTSRTSPLSRTVGLAFHKARTNVR